MTADHKVSRSRQGDSLRHSSMAFFPATTPLDDALVRVRRLHRNPSLFTPMTEIALDTPSTVYHYCSVDAARRILSSGFLWMTHISYLNDPVEATFAVDSIRQALHAVAADDRVIQLLTKRLGDLTPATHYVASFSASWDKLSQWRSYAGDGAGVAIGFSVPTWTESSDGPFVLTSSPVKYGLEGLDRDVMALREGFSAGAHRWERSVGDAEKESSYEMTAHWLADEISRSAAFRKHPGFSEEQEWRWTLRYDYGNQPEASGVDDGGYVDVSKVQSVLRDLRDQYVKRVHFREGKYGLTPYIEFDFLRHGFRVNEVVLGPRTLEHVATPAFEMLRHVHNHRFSIRRSEIPYR